MEERGDDRKGRGLESNSGHSLGTWDTRYTELPVHLNINFLSNKVYKVKH